MAYELIRRCIGCLRQFTATVSNGAPWPDRCPDCSNRKPGLDIRPVPSDGTGRKRGW